MAQLTLPGRPANVQLLAPAALSSLSLPSATTPSMCYIHSFQKLSNSTSFRLNVILLAPAALASLSLPRVQQCADKYIIIWPLYPLAGEGAGLAQLAFEDGSRVHARLVVGADGANSRHAAVCFPHSLLLFVTCLCLEVQQPAFLLQQAPAWWRALTAQTPGHLRCRSSSLFLHNCSWVIA